MGKNWVPLHSQLPPHAFFTEQTQDASPNFFLGFRPLYDVFLANNVRLSDYLNLILSSEYIT